jgi:hypothetical protein
VNDYRDSLCLLDGEYLAKCVGQDFLAMTLTFEVSPDGEKFTRRGENGVEIYKNGELTFEDIKHKLPRLNNGNADGDTQL